MRKKAIFIVLGTVLALIVTSIVLVFTVGPKVSAADNDEVVTVPLECLDISGTILNGFNRDGEIIYKNGKLKYRVEIPEGITEIQGSGFYGCSGLIDVVIPDTVSLIGNATFQNCYRLTSIEIPSSVTMIGGQAFWGCTGLTSIEIPASVTQIAAGDNWGFWSPAFSGCSGLTSITVNEANEYYYSGNGNCIVRKSDHTLITGCINTVIPSSVISIGKKAFQSCTNLTSIVIPSNVTNIASEAFTGCSNLTEIIVRDANLMTNSSLTPYANILHYGADQNTVTFVTNCETIVNDQVIDFGKYASAPTNLIKDGYTLIGWYLDEEYTKPFSFNTPIKYDITLYAKWGKNPTITFNTDGGIEIQPVTIIYNTTITRPDTNLTKTGYTFLGWYTDAECNNNFNFSTPITEDTILYAKWAKNPTVIFNSNGGSEVPTQEITYNTVVTRPTDPTKSGYCFVNWYTDAECNNSFSFNTLITEDKTLYAKWIKLHTVTFDVGTEGNPSAVDAQIVADGSYAGWTDSYRNDGWYLQYWYLDDPDDSFNFYIPITGDITLHAKWALNQYRVEFYDGNKFHSEQEIEHGAKLTKPNDPVKSHYTFLGWYIDYAGTQIYDFNEPVTQSMQLYTKWVRNYTVTFNSRGGSAVPNQTINKGDTATEPTSELEGYRLVGWYTDIDCTKQYDFATPIKANTTLYAKWEVIPAEKVANNSTVAIAVGGGVGGVAGLSVIGTIIGVVVKKRKK